MKIQHCLFIFLFWSFSGFAQTGTISGKVTDSQTGEALPFCNVFINNSTIATTTDLDGNFVLENIPEGDFEIGFSFIGYQAQQKPASIKPGSKLTFNVSLVSLEQELSDVEIKASRDRAWERELRKFKNYFLGNDDMAAQCEILNPWVIDFPADNTNNNFRAEALQPIEIENRALGYSLTFDLKQFQFTPQYYIISGATRFSDLESPDPKTKAEWERKRLETYLKSPANMFRSIILGTHNQEGFYLYGDKVGGSESRNLRSDIFANELGKSIVPYKPEQLVQPSRKPGEYRIFMKGRIEIHYEKGYSTVNTYKDAPYPISWLEVNNNYVTVNSNGMVINQKDVTFSGDMDKRKISALLPFDYEPQLQDRTETYMAKDAGGMQEKVHLHTDRPFYYKGDQLLFKAYLSYANPDLKRELSKILYLELISGERDFIIQKKFKIENGLATGDIFLPDTLQQKEYYLRAYTSWNRNYGPDTYFIQALPVLSDRDRIVDTEKRNVTTSVIKTGFSTDKETYGKREKVKVTISLTDQNDRPTAATLSISVRDAYYSPDVLDRPDILQSLTLKDVPANITTEKFTYPIEREWKVNGKFLNEKGKGEAVPFTVYLNNFEGILELESDKEGNFTLEDLDFYGPLDFAFLALDKKGKSYGSFELTPKLNPPFFVPADLKFPKISQNNEPLFSKIVEEEDVIPLQQVTVAAGKKPEGSKAIYGTADYVVQGENLNRNGNINDLLQSLKSQVPGMTVTTTLEIRIRGGATSSNLSMEPMVMIDGAVMPSGPGFRAADNLSTLNPNDIDRIEVVSRMSSMMGDLGRNGVIAVYLKRGVSQSPLMSSTTPGLQSMVIEGFGLPGNFIPFDYDKEEENPEIDQRVTLYWNPYVVTDNESGKFSFEFFTNDSKGKKIIGVEGLSIDGKPIKATYSISIDN
ncbi:carboxypeptidase-like regulatory domain-containing protein [Fontibacter flavus]|uniref:Carboxypeptidase-like regulatory domain-containing protein n=1 Tax=Fontibacter flavus TaxID=654838 RepID=A0ABV6FR40_9BACT